MENDPLDANELVHDSSQGGTGYTVVARRYRPKSFDELIGQDHIAQALEKAIASGRVGHAYLFTGARGVGKTSTARIFAKALNAPEGIDPEVAADVAHAIDAGDDMDVIEIDGASNRGIEEIRQLRANVHVRPSRSRFKIYIIDEVHMLTSQAFNALLKTLEEPPAHVKFIFCTTDPDKIPITVLSRCQRFDFAPVKFEAIQSRLKEISECEGFAVDEDALALLARRAAGSMRDSQSLLEQVMSFSSDRITVELVHSLLGTADEASLLALVTAVKHADACEAVRLVDESIRGGAEAGQLAEQLLNYLRDLLVVGVGGGPDVLKLANPNGHVALSKLARDWGTQTILAAIQILDESIVRMRTSVSSVTLLEVALVQICQLESLASIPELLERVSQVENLESKPATRVAQRVEKKKIETEGRLCSIQANEASQLDSAGESPTYGVPPVEPLRSQDFGHQEVSQMEATLGQPGSGDPAQPPTAPLDSVGPDTLESDTLESDTLESASSLEGASESVRLASDDALSRWKTAVATIDGMVADFAAMAQTVEPQGADKWKVLFPPGATKPCDYCGQPDRKAALQEALKTELGRVIALEFSVLPGESPPPVATQPQAGIRAQKMREMSEHPFVKKLCEVIDGEIIRVDLPQQLNSPKNTSEQAHMNCGK